MELENEIAGEHGRADARTEDHLMAAEYTDPAWIRVVMAGLPRFEGITTTTGHVAIARDHVIGAGLDMLAVSRWLQSTGGFGCVAYLRPASHKHAPGNCRPALHPVSYFSVPAEALEGADAQADADSAPPAAAA